MFQLSNGDNSWLRSRSNRRDLLEIGTLGLGGLGLSSLLATRTVASQASKDTSVVFLFLTGGPSQFETFDPKIHVPQDYRSVHGELATALPGVTIGGTFSRLSRWTHHMALIRSFTHNISDHTKAVQQVIRGGNRMEAGMGAILSRIRGMANQETGIPNHIYLGANEVDRQFLKEKRRLLEADGPGTLGKAYHPFEPGGNGPINQNLTLSVSPDRLSDRRHLQQSLDRLARSLDTRGVMSGIDRFEQQALELILGKSKEAFDLSKEDPRLVERYDTGRFQTGLSKYRQSTLGKQLLLARRLCESGCGFVTIHNPGWDMHGGPTQHAMASGMDELGTPVDHAVSAFLEDVADRGLKDNILLIISGEFGRTPKLNKHGGRDHWPQLTPLMLAGGGLQMGTVIGSSTPKGESPRSTPISLDNVLATVIHVLFDVAQLRLQPNLPREILSHLENTDPIHELI
ncbi:MAG: DUF1501 domain-containing protein [Planctomycetes bacterium]|nr:DUF1501 domain-containing protein [Planctomycetota bacterium]